MSHSVSFGRASSIVGLLLLLVGACSDSDKPSAIAAGAGGMPDEIETAGTGGSPEPTPAGGGGAGGQGGLPASKPYTPDDLSLVIGEPVEQTVGTVGMEGGVVVVDDAASPVDGLTITFPEKATKVDTEVTIGVAEMEDETSVLPDDTHAVSEVFEFTSDHAQRSFDRPVLVTVPYQKEKVESGEFLMVYEIETVERGTRQETRLVAATIAKRDREHAKITFATRHFSKYIVLEWVARLENLFDKDAALAATATAFTPERDGWFITNYGSIVNPGGNCIGMASFAKWFFNSKRLLGDEGGLFDKYRLGDPERWEDDEVAIEAASRAQLAETAIWKESADEMQAIGQSSLETARSFVQALHDTRDPQLLYLSQKFGDGTSGGAHAVLISGYDGSQFTLYDPNHPGEERAVSFGADEIWGVYDSSTNAAASSSQYNVFGHVGSGLFHAYPDMEAIYDGAEGAFSDESIFPKVSITSPAPEELSADGIYEVTGTSNLNLVGTITGGQANPESTLLFVNGVRFVVPVDQANGGAFAETVPLFCSNADNDDDPDNDKDNNNVIEFLVTDENGVTDYAGYERLEVNCTGVVPVARVTLSWDNGPSNDVDLWVTGPDSIAVGYSAKQHSHGAFLDFDDTEGYGPEHFIIPDGHTMPYGEYHVDVHYYADNGEGPATYTVVVEVGVIVDGVPYYQNAESVTGVVEQTDSRDNAVATFTLEDPTTADKSVEPGAQDL